MSAQVMGLGDHMVDLGCTAVLPSLFGVPGREANPPSALARIAYQLRTLREICVRREFNLFAAGKSSPIIRWLKALAASEHARCGGPGVGVIGLCFTGGFALAMAVESHVLAPVLGEPSLPVHFGRDAAKYSIDCTPADVEKVAGRCVSEDLKVLGLRFECDPFVPEERFKYLSDRLGDGFVAITLEQSAGHPDGPLPRAHSVLTLDLIDEPREPTREALDRVLALMRRKLL